MAVLPEYKALDGKAIDFLVECRGMDRAKAEVMIEVLRSDPNAQYAHVIELDAAEITPMVATPGDPGNGKYIRDLSIPVPVELAYGGTCTAGKNEDMDMYALSHSLMRLLAWLTALPTP